MYLSSKGKFIITFALILMLLNISNSAIGQEIMGLKELHRGMKGLGKTVIHGTKVEEFEVEILGILKNVGLNGGDLILVQTSGDLIEEVGGIVSGMSGSPVYIDGKLIGAISFTWASADNSVGLVTPIEYMLSVLEISEKNEEEETSSFQLDEPLILGDRRIEKIIIADNILSLNESNLINIGRVEKGTFAVNRTQGKKVPFQGRIPPPLAESEVAVMTPVQTPVMISGLSGRALQMVKDKLSQYEIQPIWSAGMKTEKNPESTSTFEPGSAIGVQLMRGDMDITYIGTLTYQKDDKSVSFGHPLLRKGDVDLFLTTAEVLKVVYSEELPFKIAHPLDLIGRIEQDRSTALSGKVKEYPDSININVKVSAKDLDQTRGFEVQMINDENLSPFMALTAILQAIDGTIDRIGEGTSQMKLEFKGDNFPSPIRRVNMFYSDFDIAVASLADILIGMTMLMNNEFKKVDLQEIDLELDIDKERKIALIEEADIDRKIANPGDRVQVVVNLRPFRQEPIKNIINFKIPEDSAIGSTIIIVRGGGVSLDQVEQNEEEKEPPKSLEEQIEDYVSRDKNNDIVIEAIPLGPTEVEEEGEVVATEEVEEELPRSHPPTEKLTPPSKEEKETIVATQTTDMIIAGRKEIKIEVQKRRELPMERLVP